MKPFHFKNTYTNHLDFENKKELGLYVHIPFCRSICNFCPYCKVVYDSDIAIKYKMALIKEIELVGTGLKDKKTVTSLYFGGGTPSLMLDEMKDFFLNTLNELKGRDKRIFAAEIAIKLGKGGQLLVANEFEMSRITIRKGTCEI